MEEKNMKKLDTNEMEHVSGGTEEDFRIYICPICGQIFKTKDEEKEHKWRDHRG